MTIFTIIFLVAYSYLAIYIADKFGKKLPIPIIVFLYFTGIGIYLFIILTQY